LIEVAGKPLIGHVFDRLRASGIERAVVNVHYLADSLEAYLHNRETGIDIVVSDERGRLMETGGGLVQARSLLGDEPFLVVNSDNLWVDGPSDAIKMLAARSIPLARNRSNTWPIKGLPATSINGLGRVAVSGRIRLPRPAAITIAVLGTVPPGSGRMLSVRLGFIMPPTPSDRRATRTEWSHRTRP
jgi:bifunctional N-acetylglucosamine-1-phosphate-uridyltransferase/glucosamine-1-phosphate-acetyltransferase GlmU-like protein